MSIEIQQLTARKLIWTITWGPFFPQCTQKLNYLSLSRALDFINVMTYDLHGIWDRKTGHHSQLKGHKSDSHKFLNSVSIKAGLPW